MVAAEAVEGSVYNIPARGQHLEYRNAVCNGWNHSKEWLLFVVYDEQNVRKIKQVMPNEEISQPV